MHGLQAIGVCRPTDLARARVDRARVARARVARAMVLAIYP